MPFQFRFGGRTAPPPAARWMKPSGYTVLARGTATAKVSSLLPNTTTSVIVTLDRSFPNDEFVPVAAITKSSGVFGTVLIKETRATGLNTVEVVLVSSSLITNKTVTVKVVGIGA